MGGACRKYQVLVYEMGTGIPQALPLGIGIPILLLSLFQFLLKPVFLVFIILC